MTRQRFNQQHIKLLIKTLFIYLCLSFLLVSTICIEMSHFSPPLADMIDYFGLCFTGDLMANNIEFWNLIQSYDLPEINSKEKEDISFGFWSLEIINDVYFQRCRVCLILMTNFSTVQHTHPSD